MRIFLIVATSILQLVTSQVILESPSSVKVSPGSPVTLSCRTNTSWRRILWSKDGSVLDTEGYQDRFLMLPDGSLFFLSTTETDSGSYYCTVISEGIEYSSDTALLTVADHDDDDQDIHKAKDVSVTVSSDSVLVEWEGTPKAEGYIVQVMISDAKEALKNITVEKDMSAVKLENIHLNTDYIIRISAVNIDGEIITKYQPKHLYLSEYSLESYEDNIPPVLWIVSLTVVVVITILTILAVAVIILKIKTFKHVNTDVDIEKQSHNQILTSKRFSQVETPWNFYGKKKVEMKTFSPDRLLRDHSSSDYDYADTDHYFLNSDTSSNYFNSDCSSTSNHYACTVLNSNNFHYINKC